MNKTKILLFNLSLLALLGCESNIESCEEICPPDKNATLSANNTIHKMTFVDSPVVNLPYQCGTKKGKTDENGTLSCFELPVTFNIGGLELGSIGTVPKDAKVFPQNLLDVKRDNTSNKQVQLMAAFLQSLDKDKNSSNIILPDNLNFEEGKLSDMDEEETKTLLQTINVEMISLEEAENNLRAYMDSINLAPIANEQNLTLDENSEKSFTLTGSDSEESDLSYTIKTKPTHGMLTGELPNLNYKPNKDYIGKDSLTFIVNDGVVDSKSATIYFVIKEDKSSTVIVIDTNTNTNTNTNNAPTATSQNMTIKKNSQSNNISLSGNDADGDSLTYVIKTQPSNGTLSGTAPNMNYTPNNNFSGSDSFTFVVNDETVDSTTATVSIQIENQAPTATAQNVAVDKNSQNNSITLAGDDADSDSLTYVIKSQPNNGTLSGTVPNVSYTPKNNFAGSDSFTFLVNDGTMDSTSVLVNITINELDNKAPTSNAQSISIERNSQNHTITLSGNDADGNSLTYVIKSQPSNGILSGTAPHMSYTPNNNFAGSDEFSFVVNDGTVDSLTATISINVDNSKPSATQQSITIDENSENNNITLGGEDNDNDTLNYIIKTNPTNGTVSGTAPNITYTVNKDYRGTDEITYVVNDGTVDSELGKVSITINSLPLAQEQNISIKQDSEDNSIILTGTDPEGSTLTYSIKTAPTQGTVTGTAPNLSYSPNEGYSGEDSLTFVVNDGRVESAPATVTINIKKKALNHSPEGIDKTITVDENSKENNITLHGVDIDGDVLSYLIHKAPEKGKIISHIKNFVVYEPLADISGEDTFEFIVSDGKTVDGSSTPPTGTITIKINAIPEATEQNITVNENTGNNVENQIILSGTDKEEDELSYTIKTLPTQGTLDSEAIPIIFYTPSEGVLGDDNLTFIVNDGRVDSTEQIVHININAIPEATEQNVTVEQNAQEFEITLKGTDKDSDDALLNFEIQDNPASGTITLDENIVKYTPTTDFTGEDSFTFRSKDEHNATSTLQTVHIEIIVPSYVRVTGQKKSYNTQGIERGDENPETGSTKDDGYYQKGKIQDYSYDAEKGTLLDNNTGLLWQDNNDTGWTKEEIAKQIDIPLHPMVTKNWYAEASYSMCSRKDDNMSECYDTSGDTASTYCEQLTLAGHTDWRLPTIGELELMIDYSYGLLDTPVRESLDHRPVFQHLYMLGGNSKNYYWTSSTVFEDGGYNLSAWGVWSVGGDSKPLPKDMDYHVRCVRETK